MKSPDSKEFPKWPVYSKDERNAVEAVLESGKVNYWTGSECIRFEEEYAKYLDVKYAISLANGTTALDLALHSIGVGKGDDVVVPSKTFIATASSVVIRGARPVFADIDPDSQNITVDTIKSVITPDTRAIIAVHFAGWPCDMDPILEFARDNEILIIEDCAQAHGAQYKNKNIGSLSDVAVFSFCQDKIISTGGEGGMFVTNNIEFYEKAWSYKDHGKSAKTRERTGSGNGHLWVHNSIGTNYRMTEMQASIGRIQLRKLNEWVGIRQRNAQILSDGFSQIPGLRIVSPEKNIQHAYYKYYVFVENEMLKPEWDVNHIISEINLDSTPCFRGGCSEV
ncbi:MAG TPA: DegT/DnrJ/EryC1/StrS family aminotransferase, partial [candidate division Zixibacteria bacterium]|nr:DegT/DnrJ/EryC1/StrS family aminotransferase [candidate division Zixibacteria bacterium]